MTTLDQHQGRSISPRTRLAAILLVVALHAVLVFLLALQRGVVPPPPYLPINISLTPPFEGGGGGRASDSGEAALPPLTLNRPPEPQPRPDSPPLTADAPVAPDAPLTASDVSQERLETAVAQGSGAGAGAGVGTGDGTGVGSGSGVGTGDGPGRLIGHRLIQGPANAVVSEGVAFDQIASGAARYAVLRCRIGRNERLQSCRVVREHPVGDGAGRDALERAREFRIRPPLRDGVYIDRHPVTIAIRLPPEGERRTGIRR